MVAATLYANLMKLLGAFICAAFVSTVSSRVLFLLLNLMKRTLLNSLALLSAAGLLMWTSRAFAFQNKCKLNKKPEKCVVEPNRGHAFTVKFPRLGITYAFTAQG